MKYAITLAMCVWFLGIVAPAFAQENDGAKLEIYLRNQVEDRDDERVEDVVSYFNYLLVKFPENDKLQDVLEDGIEICDSSVDEDAQTLSTEESISEVVEVFVEEEVLEDSPKSSASKLVTEWNFDENLVEQTWINRVNDEIRIPRWLPPIKWEKKLRVTARDRSLSLRAKWVADHRRTPHSSYYDYPAITDWFADRGVEFENHNRATSTENIGRARHTCEGNKCTDAVINDMRRIYDYFASEESYNGVHWRTMIHPEFKVVWISFAVDHDADKVFWVMHYGTKIK